jgi:hypothetical protein
MVVDVGGKHRKRARNKRGRKYSFVILEQNGRRE